MRKGRADYLWVDPQNGAVIAYLNNGRGIAQSFTSVNHGNHIARFAGGPARASFLPI